MNNTSKTNAIASKVLGEKVDAPLFYDNTILVPIPREENRQQYNIKSSDFALGYDVWNCYEVSFMTNTGLPVSGYARIIYNADNDFIIESKSLKLYLNSFNMSKFGVNTEDAIKIVTDTIEQDLSKALKTDVKFQWFGTGLGVKTHDVLGKYSPLESIINLDLIEFNQYEESPEVLQEELFECKSILKFSTNLLRSNCRVTNQPDWGTVLIEIAGENLPSYASIAKYLVSFRNESHFHEECVEMIYARLSRFNPSFLNVTALYTRRGGIDICPVRSLTGKGDLLTIDPLVLNKHTIQQ